MIHKRMSTVKQSTANRANAQFSTGPRTVEGKSASSRNAVRHNLTSKNLIILPGQEDAFAELASGLRDSLLPSGPLQEIIFTRALESAWTLERCRLATAKLHDRLGRPNLEPMLDMSHEASFTRIQKYAREA